MFTSKVGSKLAFPAINYVHEEIITIYLGKSTRITLLMKTFLWYFESNYVISVYILYIFSIFVAFKLYVYHIPFK